MTHSIDKFQQYRRKQIAELRPYLPGDDLTNISISQEDYKAGSPKIGDMIARNPKNHADQWLVAGRYFADNFAPVEENHTPPDPLLDEMAEALEFANLALNDPTTVNKIQSRHVIQVTLAKYRERKG